MREYARQKGLRRWLIFVPALTPYLSGLWLALVTPASFEIGRHLIEGLKNPTVVRDTKALEVFSIRPMGVNANGRVLIVESVIAPGNEPSFAKLLDLTMMVLPGGKERTAVEYQRLLEASGFELTQIILTSCDVSIIEGRKIG